MIKQIFRFFFTSSAKLVRNAQDTEGVINLCAGLSEHLTPGFLATHLGFYFHSINLAYEESIKHFLGAVGSVVFAI